MLNDRGIAEIIAENIGIECFSSRHYNRLAAICFEMSGDSGDSPWGGSRPLRMRELQALLARINTRWDKGFRVNHAELWYFIQ